MEITHIGEDYATIEVNGSEFEIAKGLGLAIKEEQLKVVTHNYYSKQDFPKRGSIFETNGIRYEVVDNMVINQSVAKRII